MFYAYFSLAALKSLQKKNPQKNFQSLQIYADLRCAKKLIKSLRILESNVILELEKYIFVEHKNQ